MFVGEAERLLCELVFAVERGLKNGGIVSIERDHQPVVEVRTNGMVTRQAAAPSAKVAGDADFDGYLALGKFLDQFRILNRGSNVAEAFGFQVERAPDGFGACGFSRVGCQVQTTIGGESVNLAKKLGAGAALVATNAETDDAVTFVTDGDLGDAAGFV